MSKTDKNHTKQHPTKLDPITGANTYETAQEVGTFCGLMDSIAGYVEEVRYKQSALWLYAHALKVCYRECLRLDNFRKYCEEKGNDPNTSQATADALNIKLAEATRYYGYFDIWQEYSRKYDNALLDITQDNLGDFTDYTLKTAEEIKNEIRKNADERKQAKNKQAQEGLKYTAKKTYIFE